MFSFIKKVFYNNKKNYKMLFSLLLFVIIYYLITYFYNVKEGNTSNNEANVEQSTEPTNTSNTSFYDPTIKDKIIDITATIEKKEAENEEKLAKVEGILESIEIDVNRILDRDIDLGLLMSQGR